MSFDDMKFGQPLKTRGGTEVFFIKKDDKLKNRYLVAHPELGALLYYATGQCMKDEQDNDDIVFEQNEKN